jgi:thioredoxin-related protein
VPAVCEPEKGWKGGRIFRFGPYSEANQEYAERLGVYDDPTFILLDKTGKEVRRWVGEEPRMSELP